MGACDACHNNISGRNRLWPSGLQYNARHMQITWPSISLCTGIHAGRCSAICRRQLTKIRQEYAVSGHQDTESVEDTKLSTNKQHTLSAWCPDHVVCRTRSAHEGAPSGMLFNELKGQEFIFCMCCTRILSLTPDEQTVRTAEEAVRRGNTMRQGWSWHATQLGRT